MASNGNPSGTPALWAEKVGKLYRLDETEVIALKNIQLRVEPGEFLAIAGSSGSGKTTLLNLFGCLDRPSTGKIWVSGVDTATMGSVALSHFRSKTIGFIFQNFNLLPVLTAFENVEYPLLLLGKPPAERKRTVQAALAAVGLEKQAAHRPAQLSGGQRQRVAIARAMVKTPEVVLADEPTANLDKKTALGIVDLMHDLNRREKVTFVFSSHDPMILSRASRVIYLSDGQQVGPEVAAPTSPEPTLHAH